MRAHTVERRAIRKLSADKLSAARSDVNRTAGDLEHTLRAIADSVPEHESATGIFRHSLVLDSVIVPISIDSRIGGMRADRPVTHIVATDFRAINNNVSHNGCTKITCLRTTIHPGRRPELRPYRQKRVRMNESRRDLPHSSQPSISGSVKLASIPHRLPTEARILSAAKPRRQSSRP